MFLLARPPWVRWLVGAAVVLGALAWDLSERSTEPYPFASSPIVAGAAIEDSVVEWRPIPVGSLAHPDLEGAVALTDVFQGDPLSPSVAGAPTQVPDGWWAVPIRLPQHLGVGADVRLVLGDGLSIDAIVTTPGVADDFGSETVGAVAVPADLADTVAVASAADAIVVLARP